MAAADNRGLLTDGCGLVLAGPDRGRRGNAVCGVEEDLLERAGQITVPHHGRCRGQRMMVETGQDRVQQWEGRAGHRVTLVTQGVELRRTGKSLHSVLPKAA